MKKIICAVGTGALLWAGFSVAGEGSRLSGTLTKLDVEDGTKAYGKLVTRIDECMDPDAGEHYFQATFENGKATYTVKDVSDGSYQACVYIDLDGNAGEDWKAGPGSGDLGATGPADVSGDSTLDAPDHVWSVVP